MVCPKRMVRREGQRTQKRQHPRWDRGEHLWQGACDQGVKEGHMPGPGVPCLHPQSPLGNFSLH